MNLAVLANRSKFLLNQNASVILTGVGVAGTVGTAVLTARSAFKASRQLEFAKHLKAVEILRQKTAGNGSINSEDFDEYPAFTRMEAAKLTWKIYLPAAGLGVITVSAIIIAHRVDAKKIVALTVASGVSERALKEYKEHVIEKLGPRQETKLRDDIAQSRVNNTGGSELVIVGEGKVLCMDMLTGRYFECTSEGLQQAKNKVNHALNTQNGASLSEFYEHIGLTATPYSENVGWNPDKLLELEISATVSSDGRPCLAVDFEPHPLENYWRVHG